MNLSGEINARGTDRWSRLTTGTHPARRAASVTLDHGHIVEVT